MKSGGGIHIRTLRSGLGQLLILIGGLLAIPGAMICALGDHVAGSN